MYKGYLFNEVYCLCLCNKATKHFLDKTELHGIPDIARDSILDFLKTRHMLYLDLLESNGSDVMHYLERNVHALEEFKDIIQADPLLSTDDKKVIMHLLWVDHDRLYTALNLKE